MRPLVNFSSRPFRNRRLFWFAIMLLFVIPSYFGIDAIGTLAQRRIRLKDLDAEVQRLQGQIKPIDKSATSSVTISADRNLQLVAASELIARRAFSWSKLLSDIERNIPPGVRVLRVGVAQIQPSEHDNSADSANAATLNMTVIGKSGGDVTTMINKFHESRKFKVSPISKKPVEGTDEMEFDLKVEYFGAEQAMRSGAGNQIAEQKQ